MEPCTGLGPTSALVMLWARDLYRSGSAARFCSSLDLSAGERMMRECNNACPWYSQVILNRKWFISQLVTRNIPLSGDLCQIILPAAGKSPLALELLDCCSNRIASVIELDIQGMEEKQRLYRMAAPEHAAKIRCLHADLYDREGIMRLMRATGRYDSGLRTIVITEGISYYIPPAILSGIVSLFRSRAGRNRVILDYMLPCSLVSRTRRRYPRGIWRIINRDCNPGGTVTYSPGDLERALARAGCTDVRHHTIHEIERHRTGTNRYFPGSGDGWIQIAEGRL